MNVSRKPFLCSTREHSQIFKYMLTKYFKLEGTDYEDVHARTFYDFISYLKFKVRHLYDIQLFWCRLTQFFGPQAKRQAAIRRQVSKRQAASKIL